MSKAVTALSILKSGGGTPFLSFGCRILDHAMGGIPLQGITEVAGEAGCGKTQLCLMLSLQIQLDEVCGGKIGAAAYLSCGEGTFPIRRLSQLAAAYEGRTGISSDQYLSNVHIEQCYNIEDAQVILRQRVPELCQTKNVKLLIIDSLAGLVRFEFDSRSAEDMRARTALLFALARELKLLSDIFKIGIVVVNQVKADFFDELPAMAGIGSRGSASSSTGGFGGDSVPALGMAWGYCVNTRITLHRDSAHCRACPAVPLDDAEEPEGALVSARAAGAALAGVKRSAPQYHAYAVDAEQRRRQAEDFYCTHPDDGPQHLRSGGRSEDKENASTANVVTSSGEKQVRKEGTEVESRLPLHERVCYYAGDQAGQAASATVRSARVMRLQLSPVHGPAQVAYDIGALGVRGVSEW